METAEEIDDLFLGDAEVCFFPCLQYKILADQAFGEKRLFQSKMLRAFVFLSPSLHFNVLHFSLKMSFWIAKVKNSSLKTRSKTIQVEAPARPKKTKYVVPPYWNLADVYVV